MDRDPFWWVVLVLPLGLCVEIGAYSYQETLSRAVYWADALTPNDLMG